VYVYVTADLELQVCMAADVFFQIYMAAHLGYIYIYIYIYRFTFVDYGDNCQYTTHVVGSKFFRGQNFVPAK